MQLEWVFLKSFTHVSCGTEVDRFRFSTTDSTWTDPSSWGRGDSWTGADKETQQNLALSLAGQAEQETRCRNVLINFPGTLLGKTSVPASDTHLIPETITWQVRAIKWCDTVKWLLMIRISIMCFWWRICGSFFSSRTHCKLWLKKC